MPAFRVINDGTRECYLSVFGDAIARLAACASTGERGTGGVPGENIQKMPYCGIAVEMTVGRRAAIGMLCRAFVEKPSAFAGPC